MLITGQGSQQYSEFFESNKNNWSELFKRFLIYDTNFTRIDIAHDIFNELLSVNVLQNYIKSGLCISKAKTSRYYEDNILESGEIIGETVEIGNKGNNNIQLCVYNKLMQQYSVGNIHQIVGIDSWVRSEMRYFGQRANQIALKISGEEPLKKIFFSTIAGFIRFISPINKYKKDSNRWRRPLVSWWSEYLENEEATKLEIRRKKLPFSELKIGLK
ncbi:replication initiation factor domain-containing protein [Enterococcus avium]|uniref:replication initiation factor domain-containing protein n=1 Tax=Enterococcus avium TaxID=33945 RepID=UPI001788D114|nr:replication initiation factor domain-containing protein [Enterococcus avium]